MFVQTEKSRYHVVFEQNRSGPRAATSCKIFLLTTNHRPILVAQGKTLQGKKDIFNAFIGYTFALTRALANYCFHKSTRTLFWKVFHQRYRHEAFANIGGLPVDSNAASACQYKIVAKGRGKSWCTKYKSHCEQQCESSTIRKLFSRRALQHDNRSRAANQQLCETYDGDYSSLERKMLRGVWLTESESVPGYGGLVSFRRRTKAEKRTELTTLMVSMSLTTNEEFKKLDAELLSRAGVTKVHDEYIIDPNEFVSPFKLGEVVTSGDETVEILEIVGPALSIQPVIRKRFRNIWTDAMARTVMDWQVEKRPHWLRRAIAKCWGEIRCRSQRERPLR